MAKQIGAHVLQVGADCFLDEADIEAGDDFEARIREAMDGCSELLVLITPWALERPYIWIEIGAAWGQRKRIVGVLHGLDISDLEAGGSPVLLKRIEHLPINDLERYFRELRRRVRK